MSPIAATATAKRPTREVPEYVLETVKRARATKLQSRHRLGLEPVLEKRPSLEAVEVDTPDHVIPFAARFLRLHLAPPHGSFLPPPPRRPPPGPRQKQARQFSTFRPRL